ncbi:MAG: glyoxalase superfamily protein [Planktomarina sp.]
MEHLYSVPDLKLQANQLRADTPALSQTGAYEALAKSLGFRNWNTLRASAIDWSIGDRVRGRYLGQAFKGAIIGLHKRGPHIALTLQFDQAVDVVTSEHFSNFRSRVTVPMRSKNHSAANTSDGTPHLVLY